MAVLSRLLVTGAQLLKKSPVLREQIRKSGHCHWDSHFDYQASRWSFYRFKDMCHFYFWVISAPFLAVMAYTNTFIGPAKLAAIPEGYEPKEWEYERHPITRFFVKYIAFSFQQSHEMRLHYFWEEERLRHRRMLRSEVHRLIALHDDYAAWYYKPVPAARHARMMDASRVARHEEKGTF